MSRHSSSNGPKAKLEILDSENKFTEFMRRLLAVPHSEIKAALDAEKAAKRASKRSSSRRASRPKV